MKKTFRSFSLSLSIIIPFCTEENVSFRKFYVLKTEDYLLNADMPYIHSVTLINCEVLAGQHDYKNSNNLIYFYSGSLLNT